MNELIKQTGAVLEQSQTLLSFSDFKGKVMEFLSWIEKVLENKKSVREKLALLEQQQADSLTIEGIKANLEYVLEDKQELQKELAEKLKEIEDLAESAGITIQGNNTIKITGNSKTIIQDVNGGSKITIN